MLKVFSCLSCVYFFKIEVIFKITIRLKFINFFFFDMSIQEGEERFE